ncbi:pleckstrin homology domain-containing family J member 1-like [Lineus longissimus]|uniref:pleckstrin homology domain-containing family J member 1-like n=1 Tax=Lineus longissimus TaxID=88925 RepID=UPI002B4DDE9E
MRFNERELKFVARTGVTEKEGNLRYRNPYAKRDGYKSRWFRLKGNLLFYFRSDEHGGLSPEQEVKGVMVLERYQIQLEQLPDRPFVFSIYFENDADKKHYFSCASKVQCEEWVDNLRKASFENMRHTLAILQAKLIKKTGRDPILTMSLGHSIVPKTLYQEMGRKFSMPDKSTKSGGVTAKEIAELLAHPSSAPSESQYLM